MRGLIRRATLTLSEFTSPSLGSSTTAGCCSICAVLARLILETRLIYTMDFNLISSVLDLLEPHLSIAILQQATSDKIIDEKTSSSLRLKYLGRTHLFSQLREALEKSSSASKDALAKVIEKINESEGKAKQQRQELESMASVQALKSAIAEKYEEFGQHKFAKSFLESHEGLNSISLSRKNLGECIQWARLLYNSGEYGVSSQAITVLSSLVDDPADILNMIWAKLANLLVLGVKGDTAAIHSLTEDFKHIKSRLDLKSVQSQAQRMALSCAFIFYSIIAFVYLPQKETKLDFIFELFLEERNLSAIQLCSPVLLRYLVLIYMVSYDKKSLKIDHRTLANIIKSEVCSYQDTFTQFVKTLYIDFDLSGLKGHIEKIRDEVKKDILFSKYSEVIVESCRKMYFEVYSKIYSSVEVKTVAEFLGLGQEEAEIWIVNLFRKNNIKATVDEKNGLMVIGGQTNDDGEGLHKRAKELMARNRILLNNVSKVLDTK